MKRAVLITLILILVAYTLADQARAYTVNLIYYASAGLMDENMALLEDGCIIQLIFTNDATISPPAPWNGRPQGDDVLWEYTSTGTGIPDTNPGTGQFLDMYQYTGGDLGKYVYIRFFNASSWPDVTFYGQSPLHTLTDFFTLDIWDVTAGGLYLWTEYPFMIIPEPETWLTMLPALIFAIFIFRRKRKEKKTKTG
jgi:hypothetical protein